MQNRLELRTLKEISPKKMATQEKAKHKVTCTAIWVRKKKERTVYIAEEDSLEGMSQERTRAKETTRGESSAKPRGYEDTQRGPTQQKNEQADPRSIPG